MTAFTRTWNTAYEQVPADTDDASEGAQRIRNSREDTRERIEVDHSMAGDADDGAHKKLTLIEQAGDPTFVANRGFVYCKDDSGDTELYFMDDIGTVMQITQDGLLNPSLITAAQEPHTLDNIALDVSVAANAITIALKDKSGADPTAGSPVKIALRHSTLTTGQYNIRTVSGALSLVVPQGATLGFGDGEGDYMQVFAIDNAGTVELAVIYSTNLMPMEIGVQSTTAINSSADSEDVLYSTTARSNVPARHIGTFLIQTGGTAGDWSNAPVGVSARSQPAVQTFQLPILTADLGTSMVLLDTKVISSDATIDFTDYIDNTYSEYLFAFEHVVPATDNVKLYCRLAIASVFQSGVSAYGWVIDQVQGNGGTSQQTTIIADGSDSKIELVTLSNIDSEAVGSAAGEGLNGQMILTGPDSTTIFKKVRASIDFDSSVGYPGNARGTGKYNTAGSAIDGVRFYFAAGNLESGTIRMYGIKGA